nr:hypothetical protein [Rhodoferax sp.]
MTSSLSTRKTVYQVTREDFAVYPIWEWAIGEDGAEGEDESFVRPTLLTSIPKREFGQFVVAANSKLRKGNLMPACAEVTVRGDIASVNPMSIFLNDRHLDIVAPETTRALSYLTQEVDNYPATWELNVPFEGEAIARYGRVPRSMGLQLLAMWRRLKIVRQPSVV